MLYTNALPTAAMTAVMPMLYEQAGDLASVAPNINLFVTGPLLAQQMGEVAYTAVDKILPPCGRACRSYGFKVLRGQ